VIIKTYNLGLGNKELRFMVKKVHVCTYIYAQTLHKEEVNNLKLGL